MGDWPAFDGADEVVRQAGLMLRQVGSALPTPVEDVLACAELIVAGDLKLIEQNPSLLQRASAALKSALNKVLGLVDLRDNVVYLDMDLSVPKQRFVKLHESGHKALVWQRDSYLYVDDERTLSPDVKALFERQANLYAAELLFQLDRFCREAADLPLSLRSAVALGQTYGASAHASIRRYAERNRHPCALLVLERTGASSEDQALRVRYAVQSLSYQERYTGRSGGPLVSVNEAYFAPVYGHEETAEGETVLHTSDGQIVPATFEVFDNTYNPFVLIKPAGVGVKARRRVVVVR